MEAHSVTPTFHGEVQLCSWSETHNGGCKVTFWLADASDLDVFRALTVRKGNTAGHRFYAALVEVGDDELPVQPAPTKDLPSGGALAKLAGMWCSDPSFWEWLLHAYAWKCVSADDAATLIRQECNVESRAELDSNTKAERIFHDRIRIPFMRWKQGVRG